MASGYCLSSGFGVPVMCLRNCPTYMEWTVIWTWTVIWCINPHTWVVSPGCALLAGCRCCPWHCDDMPHDALIWSCWFGHVLMPSLSLWTAWHARNSDLIMLFCDMVVAVCICEVVESDFCLSSGFGVLVMCLRITIPFSHVGVASHKSHHMTSQCIMWHHRTQEIASHKMKTHQITSRDISQLTTFTHQPQNVGSHPATNHIKTGQHTTTMERFGHRSRWSPCAHSIGKFFLWLIVFFLETSAPGLPGSTCKWSYHPYK